jgi:hypothetical protein
MVHLAEVKLLLDHINVLAVAFDLLLASGVGFRILIGFWTSSRIAEGQVGWSGGILQVTASISKGSLLLDFRNLAALKLLHHLLIGSF